MIIKKFSLKNIDGTRSFAKVFSSLLRAGDIITLIGDLGAGKTELCRSIIHALGYEEDVPSPTFSLLQIYEPSVDDMMTPAVWHTDLYRIESPEEVYELGLDEGFDSAITLIEWPDRMGDLLPVDHLRIELSFSDAEGSREIKLEGGKSWNERLKELSL